MSSSPYNHKNKMNNRGLFYRFLVIWLVCVPCTCQTVRRAPPKRISHTDMPTSVTDDVLGRMIQEWLSLPPKRSIGSSNDAYTQHDGVIPDKSVNIRAESYVTSRPKNAQQLEETSRSRSSDLVQRLIHLARSEPSFATNQMDRYGTRDSSGDHVINGDSNDIVLPWQTGCSDGFKLCGGYFPPCCESFVCHKPVTDADRRQGLKRCWPSHFLANNED